MSDSRILWGKLGIARARLTGATVVLLASAWVVGCLDATQIDIELTTDVNCSDRPETAISVGKLGQLDSSSPVAVTSACDAKTGRIGSIVVLPPDSKQGQVGIEVVAGIVKTPDECRRDHFVGGCIVARRSLNFVKHHGLELPIELEAACVDVPCGATETCRKGACVSAQVDPESCATESKCAVVNPSGGTGGVNGLGGNSGVGGFGGPSSGGSGGSNTGGGTGGSNAGRGGGGASGAAASGGDAGGTDATGGDRSVGGGGGTIDAGGAAGQASAGDGGRGGSMSQAGGGAGGIGAGASAGAAQGGTGGQPPGGSGGQINGAGAGGAAQLGPRLVASDSISSSGLVSTISPTKALLPEHAGDILFAWVCITSQLGSASPQDGSFWHASTNAPGMTLFLEQLRCQLFTATATGGTESHAFSIFPSSSASVQRLEFAVAKPPPASPPADSGFPTTAATTAAMTISQNHSALVYFFGVSGATTLAASQLGAGAQTTPFLQVSGGGVNKLTSGIAVAYDQPTGAAPKVNYAPANTGIWSSAGIVLSPTP